MEDAVGRELKAIDTRLKAIGMLLLLEHLPEDKRTERDRILTVAASHLGIPKL